jgi:c-di-AMP phosphodiesterase-like protein
MNLHRWHSFQIISLIGIITAIIIQLLLFLLGKHVDRIWALYPTWVFFFTIGYLLRRKEESSHEYMSEFKPQPKPLDSEQG